MAEASTDTSGYGAIAGALHPNGHDSLVGIALGKKSQAEAVTMALKHCREAGGTHAKSEMVLSGVAEAAY